MNILEELYTTTKQRKIPGITIVGIFTTNIHMSCFDEHSATELHHWCAGIDNSYNSEKMRLVTGPYRTADRNGQYKSYRFSRVDTTVDVREEELIDWLLDTGFKVRLHFLTTEKFNDPIPAKSLRFMEWSDPTEKMLFDVRFNLI